MDGLRTNFKPRVSSTNGAVQDIQFDMEKLQSNLQDNAKTADMVGLLVQQEKENYVKSKPGFDAMTPEQQKVALACEQIHCMNHGLSLLSGASHKKEAAAISELMEKGGQPNHGAEIAGAIAEASGIQLTSEQDEAERQAAPQVIRAVSKMFSTEGDHGMYHLNESEHLKQWCRQKIVARAAAVKAVKKAAGGEGGSYKQEAM